MTLKCGVNRVRYDGAKALVNLFEKLQNLTKLNIDFYENYVGDFGSLDISKGIKYLTNLKEFDFNLNFNDIRDWGAIELVKELSTLTNLTRLRLDMGQNEILDEGAYEISDSLLSLAKTTKVDFLFVGTAIDNETAIAIQEKFKGH